MVITVKGQKEKVENVESIREEFKTLGMARRHEFIITFYDGSQAIIKVEDIKKIGVTKNF